MATVEMMAAEIGSTTTVVSALAGLDSDCPHIIAQGQAATTVLEGDVTVGLYNAITLIEEQLGEPVKWEEMVASSSAAGGLKMTVHGLVYDMTAKAAREAALGAGANVHLVTAGELNKTDLDSIEAIRPNIILLAGGVDYGEKNTVIGNAHLLTELSQPIPVIFAGNTAAGQIVCNTLRTRGFPVTWVENVYPRIDKLNVEPTRRVIHDIFEKHIVEAPGMQKIRLLAEGRIIPTPGAVMRAAQLLRESIGDLMVVDVGGATTDVHSVCEVSPEIAATISTPEPLAKRTVEGDLGVFVNAENVLRLCNADEICKSLKCSYDQLAKLVVPIPVTDMQQQFVGFLTEAAVKTAIRRHAGVVEYIYGPSGRIAVTRGKDLTTVKWVIGTGGALTRLPQGAVFLARVNTTQNDASLLPRDAKVLIDQDYIMAVAGLLVDRYPRTALKMMMNSLFPPA